MDSNQLFRSHQAGWQSLTNLLNRAEKDIRRLSPAEIEQLGQLYRIASSDLALARRDFPKHQVTAYLNQLVAHGHAVIYHSEPLVGSRFRRFFTEDFPRVYRQMLAFTLTATLLFWIPAILLVGIATPLIVGRANVYTAYITTARGAVDGLRRTIMK